jgi:uncharacterized membrane protein YoaK (UPF0700 family)
LHRTRLSLFYLAGYLLGGGIAFLLAPHISLQIFQSTGEYEPVMVRFVGVLLLALGILIAQLIRRRAFELYPTTLLVRAVILAALAAFYVSTRDPIMIILFGIVAVGWVLTLTAYLTDRRQAAGTDGPNG